MDFSSPLTNRQQHVLEALDRLAALARGGVHYSAVARQVGIRNTAAYEMLKSLEQNGYVSADYILPGGSGPGRSTVVFSVTAQGRAALRGPTLTNRDSALETFKRQILSRLGEGERVQEELLDELLARLPNVEEPLIYCAELITALLLNLGREARQRLGEQGALLQRLAAPRARSLVSLLPGMALGLALPESSHQIPAKLIEYTGVCQAYLQQLDETKQKALGEFVHQVLDALPDVPQAHERAAAAPLTSE